MQAGANRVAALTPCQGRTGCGARQRSAPTGGAAKGTPSKTPIPPAWLPWISPPSTRSGAASAAAQAHARRVAKAAMIRRFTDVPPALPER